MFFKHALVCKRNRIKNPRYHENAIFANLMVTGIFIYN